MPLFLTTKETAMNTQQYLEKVRTTTGFTDYRIAKDFGMQQTHVSKYNRGKLTLSESHAFIFSEVLNIPADKIIADTKLENATIKNNDEKIAFWQHQVNRLKNGVAGAFVFGVVALSPINEVYADEAQPVTQSSSYFILC
jgi:transcriptional regulator with XRE-family HTH domain